MTKNRTKTGNNDGFDPVRNKILREMLKIAPFDGWTSVALRRAVKAAGVEKAAARGAFRGGVRDVLKFWSMRLDEEMAAAMVGAAFDALKIREKVTFAVQTRLDALEAHREAARRAAAFLALPPFAPLAAKLTWSTADAVWRGLRDTSTDFNYYSKRAILSGVWTSTFARWLADDTGGEATRSFLAARIDNVMQIEKAKSAIRKSGFNPAAPIGWLARLRYPKA